MIKVRSTRQLTSEECSDLDTILGKRGIEEQHVRWCFSNLGVAYEQRGRMTLCLLMVAGLPGGLYWGACRKDMRDAGNPEVGQRVAFAKAVKDYAANLYPERQELQAQVRLTARNVQMLETV